MWLGMHVILKLLDIALQIFHTVSFMLQTNASYAIWLPNSVFTIEKRSCCPLVIGSVKLPPNLLII